jgi:hypothetical protein
MTALLSDGANSGQRSPKSAACSKTARRRSASTSNWLDRVEDRSLVREPMPYPIDHQPLEVPCRNAPAIWDRRLAAGDQPLGDVVAVTPALLVGVGRREPFAGLVE